MNSPSDLDRVTFNPSWLRAEVAQSLRAIEELSSYLTFLEAARDQKSKDIEPVGRLRARSARQRPTR